MLVIGFLGRFCACLVASSVCPWAVLGCLRFASSHPGRVLGDLGPSWGIMVQGLGARSKTRRAGIEVFDSWTGSYFDSFVFKIESAPARAQAATNRAGCGSR